MSEVKSVLKFLILTVFLIVVSLDVSSCLLNYLERSIICKIPWKFQKHDIPSTTEDEHFFSSTSSSTKAISTLNARSNKVKKRMEYLCLNDTQRHDLHQGFIKMKQNNKDGLNEYDTFVLYHDYDRSPTAHHGPSFILWHRFYLLMMESVLQSHHHSNMLPLWDNRLLSRSGPNPRESVYFSSELFGEAHGEVTTGFAAYFKTPNSSFCQEISKTLTRAVPSTMDGLFEETFVEYLHSRSLYQDLCIPWDSTFEAVHGLIHVFVGELMAYLACAPSDPLFFLHHTFVDYLYEKHFRKIHQQQSMNLTYPDVQDEDDDIKKYSGHITMMPFGIKHEEMLNSDSFVPQYETSPGDVECNEDSECCSNNNVKYVWCNKKTKKCAAKVQQGGAVKEGFPASACYCMEGNVPFIENLKCACKPPI